MYYVFEQDPRLTRAPVSKPKAPAGPWTLLLVTLWSTRCRLHPLAAASSASSHALQSRRPLGFLLYFKDGLMDHSFEENIL